jgi:hypothetical protein
MKKLSAAAYRRASDFLRRRARPLEQALFAHEFEGAPASAVLGALRAFRNADGGFGRALEPDLRMPASSVLATSTALDALRELGAGDDEPLVRDALAWAVARFEPEVPGWRYVPADVDAFPHAPWWSWELHRPGGPWDHLVNPGARLLSQLSHWPRLAPRPLVESLGRAFEKHVTALTSEVGGDSLHYAVQVDNERTRAKLRELAVATVIRDPAAWTSYCAKPLKLAPLPDSPLAECLASEIARNFDWEIDQQAADGSWLPNWDWQGHHPGEWPAARREWQGEVTLRTLRSLRAYGRIEGL